MFTLIDAAADHSVWRRTAKFGWHIATAGCDHGVVPAPAFATEPATRRQLPASRYIGPIRGLTPTASRILQLQRTAGNRAVTQALASVQRDEQRPDVISGADRAATPQPRRPPRTTGFLGLNPGADKELGKLKKTTGEDVLSSLNDPVAEAKLKDNSAVADFVFDELGVSVGDFAKWDKATDVLLNADPLIREQLAEVMRWFNKAENGEILLDRLVLSGHSNGVQLWGESEEGRESQPGTMLLDRDLRNIAAVFPKATEQVEDIMFSACFSINAVELVIKVFPNLKTAWAYTSFSPSAKQGSDEHIAEFTRATEGAGTLKRSNRRGSSALWTKEKGYVVGDPSLAAAGGLYTEAFRLWSEVGHPMFLGDKADLTSDQLMPTYAALQRMIAHPGTDAELRKRAVKVMDICLHLRFWPKLREKFQTTHRATLQPAYDALGIAQPDWSKMTRMALKAHMETVKKALEANADATTRFKPLFDQYLTDGLYKFKDEKVIPPGWI
jgi:hypothetical protein